MVEFVFAIIVVTLTLRINNLQKEQAELKSELLDVKAKLVDIKHKKSK